MSTKNDDQVIYGRILQFGIFGLVVFFLIKFYITGNFGVALTAILYAMFLDYFITPTVDEVVKRRNNER